MRTNQRKKVAFINLPDSRLDVFSRVTNHMEYRPEVAIHVDPSATVVKMADLLQVPTSTQLRLLRRFPCQLIVVPDDRPDLKVEVAEFAGNPPALIITVSELAARLGPPRGSAEAPASGGDAGWHIPLQGGAHRGSAAPADADEPAARTESRPAVDWISETATPMSLHRRTPASEPAPHERPDRPRVVRARALDAVEELRSTLNLTSDKQDLLERILQIAVTSVKGDAGSIMLLDESGEFLRIAVAVGLSHDVITRTRQRIGEGVAGNVMLEGRGRILRDKLRDPRYRDGRERTGIQCAVSVPILMGEQPIGVLNVSSDDSTEALNERSQAQLEKFGVEMASVILKAMEQSDSGDQTLEATLIQQVDHRMVLLEPLEQRLQGLARLFGAQFGDAICRIYVLDGTGRRLVPLGVHDPGALAPAVPLSARTGLAGRVFQRQEPEALLPRVPSPDPRGLILVPFRGEDPIGLLEIEDVKEELAVRLEHVQLLSRVAYHLGQYIEAERATRVMARRSRQIMHLSDLAVEMLGEVTLEILIDMALASAAGLFDADLAGLRLYPEEDVTFSDPELAERDSMEMRSLLDFDRILAEATRRHRGIYTAETLPPDLADLLTAQRSIRWVAAIALHGPAGALGVLTLYGLSEGSVGLADEEHDVLERFCGYLIQGLTRALCDPADMELPDRFVTWEGFQPRVAEAANGGSPVGVAVFSIERLGVQALERGRSWVDAAHDALHGFLYRNLGAGSTATRIREGRYALLAVDPETDVEALAGRLLAGWPEAAAASGVESLSRLPFTVDTFAFPRDSRNLEEFLDLVADRFGVESGVD